MTSPDRVTDADMPQLFQAADKASLAGQRRYVGGTRVRLILIVMAAACGITSWRVGSARIDILGICAVVLFVAALAVESFLWSDRPDKAWYDGRAVAESVKTLAWKFAVGAPPFPIDLDDTIAINSFIKKLDSIQSQFSELDLEAIDSKVVSDWMVRQRSTPWENRRSSYLQNRLQNQKDWYAKKAKYNKKRSKQWRFALVSLEVLGAIAALLEALTQIGILIGPTIAAVVGAVVAWVETKQHDSLARAYSAAVADLAKAESKLSLVHNEATWASEVNDAEDAISREHTLWLASRSRS